MNEKIKHEEGSIEWAINLLHYTDINYKAKWKIINYINKQKKFIISNDGYDEKVKESLKKINYVLNRYKTCENGEQVIITQKEALCIKEALQLKKFKEKVEEIK